MTGGGPAADGFDDRVGQLSASRRELLARLQAAKRSSGRSASAAPPPVRRRQRDPAVSAAPAAAPAPTTAPAPTFDDRVDRLAPSRQALLRALRDRRSAPFPLRRPLGPAQATPLVPLQPRGTRPPLVCVHAISGSIFVYTALARLLGDDQPVHGLEAPGFDGAAEPVDRLEDLAATYRHAIASAFGDRPVHLLGWSMGGIVAYEIARQIWTGTGRITPVVMVDSAAPIGVPEPGRAELITYFLRELTGGTTVPTSGDGTLEAVVDRLRSTGVLPADLSTEVALTRFTVLRANVRALHRYVPPGPYPGLITSIVAEQSLGELDHWTRLTGADGGTAPTVTPGNHYTVWDGPNLTRLGALIRAALQ